MDTPSFLISGLPILGLIFFVFFKKEKKEIDKRDEKSKEWGFIGSMSLQMGLLGGFIGTILVLKNMNQPQLIGPSVAVCILSGFYSLVLFLISFFTGEIRPKFSFFFIPLLQLLLSINTLYIMKAAF